MRTSSPKVRKPLTLGALSPTFSSEILSDLENVLYSKRNSDPGFAILHSYYLTKYNGEGTADGPTRLQRALDKWLAVEEKNDKTNTRVYASSAEICGIDTTDLITLARRFVQNVIGSDPEMEVIFQNSGFTNGASTRVKRAPTAIAEKFVGKPHVTTSAIPIFRDYLNSEVCMWSLLVDLQDLETVEHSVLFTVPKNSEIDRVACKEPEINMFLQRGVGITIRDLLKKRTGIDLRDQTRNQRLARLGSIDGSLATIDLSSASDTVSTALVAALLPPSWFVLLNDLRVKQTLLPDGTIHELNMFSSMGNGFTFELETLVFYALACAINALKRFRGTVSVYGDDIITPSQAAKTTLQVFHWLGFKVNPKKSFHEGPFRESCGKFWYAGSDVTPFYIKEPINHQSRLIHLLNRFRLWSTTGQRDLDPDLFNFWKKWSVFVNRRFHGGKDLDRIDALVTLDNPRHLLTQAKTERRASEVGAYLHWLHTTEEKRGSALLRGLSALGPLSGADSLITSCMVEVLTSRWVSRPNRTWELGIPTHFFAQEIDPDAGSKTGPA